MRHVIKLCNHSRTVCYSQFLFLLITKHAKVIPKLVKIEFQKDLVLKEILLEIGFIEEMRTT